LDDCWKSYLWLISQGLDARQIVIGGDSAGGNLALATLQRVLIEEKPTPACAILLSPFLDLTLSGGSILDNARHDPVFTPAFGIGIRKFYAHGARHSDCGVSPLFGSFRGLPPLLLQVGSTEMLLDDAVRAAELANAAGVPTCLEIWDRLPHVFQGIPKLPHARAAGAHIVRFISGHTGWDFHLPKGFNTDT
jgi:acetyl esterase/lipase